MDERTVVTCFLRHDGAVLLLRRSEDVGSYAGTWGAVAGHADGDPATAARQEIREETGLDSEVTFVCRGDPFSVVDEDLERRWTVHPFLFDSTTRDIDPNWETSEFEWVAPTAIRHRETVPELWESYDRVRPTVETVESDHTHGASSISVRALEVLRDEAALLVADSEADDAGGDPASDGWNRLVETATNLLAARPSMSVVQNRVNRVMHAASTVATPAAVEHVASTAISHAISADRRAAACATERIADQRVATLSRSGTVLTALKHGTPEAVLVAESRPGREGVGVAESLAGETDVTLTSDAAFAHALAEWGADTLLVGADTVLADGRVLNKVGTRAGAIASGFETVDVLVVTAVDKISSDGTTDVEPRDRSELYDGDSDIAVLNPTFDVTPADCIDAVVTERGPLDVAIVGEIARQHSERASWQDAV